MFQLGDKLTGGGESPIPTRFARRRFLEEQKHLFAPFWRFVFASKHPQQIEEQPRLFRNHINGSIDLLGQHQTEIKSERIIRVVARNDLMASHARSSLGVDAKVIVVKSVPDGSGADVFIIVGQLPVAFLSRITQRNANVIRLRGVAEIRGSGIVCCTRRRG